MTATADMVVTTARAGLTPSQWSTDFFREYIRGNQFTRYFGTTAASMIQLRDELTRKPGDSVVFGAVRRLTAAGVTGNTTLEGQEEQLNSRSLKVTVDVIRHAIAVTDWDEQKSVIDLLQAGRDGLMDWAVEKIRADIISALGAITIDGNVSGALGAVTDAQCNSWLTNNTDRIQFGAVVANSVSNDWSTSMATLDNTADLMTAATLSLAKRRARTASPHIRPIRLENGEEWYVALMPSLVFRDFRKDANVLAANQYAQTRGDSNPLFAGGDLLWDGIVVREIPEIPVYAGGGTNAHATLDTAFTFLCGAQAVGIAWAQKTQARTNNRDYGFQHGAGIMEIRGVQKLRFGKHATVDTTTPVDNGVFTIVTTAVGDA